MTESVDLLIFPNVQEGQDASVVKEKLIKTLRVEESKVDEWFGSAEPTTILKEVDQEVADRYVKAILNCGAQCEIRPTGKDSLSLMPKPAGQTTEMFMCPSCEHEEEVEIGSSLAQCPKCGLVIAKWAEKIAEEAEKEKIRRRLLREARLKDDSSTEFDRKKAELERLRKLEREIMKELGLKTPSAAWLFFERYPVSLSFAVSAVIVMATGVAFYYVDAFLDRQVREELIVALPSAEIQEIAPLVGAAVQLKKSGNEQVVAEIANVSEVMRGQGPAAREAIINAAQQMMKGAEPEKFVASAMDAQRVQGFAKPAEGDAGPIAVNLDTIGGIAGLTGSVNFDPETLASISRPLLEDGHELLLAAFAEKRLTPDPLSPDGPDLIVEAIDEMDGSMVVDLMNSLSRDPEWDLLLVEYVRGYLNNAEYDKASMLADQIRNPLAKVAALSEVITSHMVENNLQEVKLLNARIRTELDKVEDKGRRANALITLGQTLSAYGAKSEPSAAFSRVEAMAKNASNPMESSAIHTRLAVAYMIQGARPKARQHFALATNFAGRIKDTGERISAFTTIARGYYDVRNTTLANKILAEAEILAATRLEPGARSAVFGKIAIARGYMGDFPGAELAISNASQGKGRQQLLAKLAESLLAESRYYEAMSIMENLQSDLEVSRLEARLIAQFVHTHRIAEASGRIDRAVSRVRRIADAGDRGLMLSLFARLAGRVGKDALSEALFTEAMVVGKSLDKRKAEVNVGLVALNRARNFQFTLSQDALEQVSDIVVRDPVSNEIVVVERIVRTMLPEGLVRNPPEV